MTSAATGPPLGWIPRTSPNSAGTSAADIDRLIWRAVGALFPDDYPQTYGIRSFFGL